MDYTSLLEIYKSIKNDIEARISDFDSLKSRADNMEFLKEMVFCLMTPQSKATVCAKAADNLFERNRVFDMSQDILSDSIKNVRFRNNKARYIKEAIDRFKNIDIKNKIEEFDNIYEARQWFVSTVKGLGFKEASHFLRNTGFGYDLAILDRHILKNLVIYGVLDEIPKSITPKKYLEIEEKMINFSKIVNIPMHHLDFVLWFKETNGVFK